MPIQYKLIPQERRHREVEGLLHSPVSSTADSIDDDDFVLVNENTMEARWSGDQTRYVPLTTYEALKMSATQAWDGVTSDSLTTENLVKHTVPLAKDLGVVAKEAAVAAKGLVGKAVEKMIAVSMIDSGADPSAVASGHNNVAIVDVEGFMVPAEGGLSDVTGSWSPPSNAFDAKTQGQPRLSDVEEIAIANAIIDGDLSARNKNGSEEKAFLAKFRKEQTGLYWSTEADTGFDPLGVSDTYKRPVNDDKEGKASEKVRKEWAAKEDGECSGSDEMEEIELGKAVTEDPEEAEELLPGAYPDTEIVDGW